MCVIVTIASQSTASVFENEADVVVYLKAPKPLYAIEQFYKNLKQISDMEVTRLLMLDRIDMGSSRE